MLHNTKVAKKNEKWTETFSVGHTELGFRDNQEFLTLILNPNSAVFLGYNDLGIRDRNSGLH